MEPVNTEALYSIARALEKTGSLEAKSVMERHQVLMKSERFTDRVKQLGNFGLAAADAGNYELAVARITEALKFCGECEQSADLHRNLGLIHCRNGDLDKGERELRLALNLRPDDADALKAMAIIESRKRTSK